MTSFAKKIQNIFPWHLLFPSASKEQNIYEHAFVWKAYI